MAKTKKKTIKRKKIKEKAVKKKAIKKIKKKVTQSKAVKAKKTKSKAKKGKVIKKQVKQKINKNKLIKKKTSKKKYIKVKITPKDKASQNFIEIEQKLIDQKAELLKSISKSSTHEKDISKLEHGNFEDMAATSLEREMTFAMGSREREGLHMINSALVRIAKGTYGKCENCGEKINIKRLKIVPFAQYCMECKSNMEQEIEREGDTHLPD